MNTPHSIAADAKGNIYVGDRGNRRIMVYDHDGSFVREIRIDVPSSAVVGDSPGVRSFVSERASRGWSERRALGHLHHPRPDAVSLQRRRLSRTHLQIVAGWPSTGVLGSSGRQMKQFGWIHEMACPAENEIYAAEILNWRVQKLILHPAKSSTATN